MQQSIIFGLWMFNAYDETTTNFTYNNIDLIAFICNVLLKPVYMHF